MKAIAVLLYLTLSTFMGYAQSSDDQFPEYPWLNKTFPIDTLFSYESDTLPLFKSDKRYVMSFWFTNCQPCLAEIDWLNKLKQDYADETIEFIAISFDSKEKVDKLMESHPFNYTLCYMERSTIDELQLSLGYPTNVIVDSDGTVVFQKSGGSPDPEKAKMVYDVLSEELLKLKNSEN